MPDAPVATCPDFVIAPDFRRLTRGQFLRAASGAAAGLALTSNAYGGTLSGRVRNAAPAPDLRSAGTRTFRSFRSRPDLRPPPVRIRGRAAALQTAAGEGYFFLAPTGHAGAQAGPLIVDSTGEPVWFAPVPPGLWSSNFRVQQYRGKPVLTWWEGTVLSIGYGQGEGVIVDSSYREIARVRAGNGRHADLHEFTLTPHGTALVTCYPATVDMDLSAVGGSRHGQVLESIIQEVEVRTGRVVFEWRSLEHIPIEESYMPPGGPYDYLHANSIDITPDGRLLISARHTCALYKLTRRTGRVIWRLGGKRSNFRMAPGTRFAWQHDARHLPDGNITVFDDGAGPVRSHSQSRGLVLQVDRARRRVRLARAYRHPHPLLAYAMGSMQTLPDGNVTVAWGNVPVLSEFAADGTWLADVEVPWGQQSYRGYHLPWIGTPHSAPTAAIRRSAGSTRLYASWNGATGVSAWELSLGPRPTQLNPALVASRHGFETTIPLPVTTGYAAITALDSSGRRLGRSRPVKI
jgi:Arylsulfotransferase (ASST)